MENVNLCGNFDRWLTLQRLHSANENLPLIGVVNTTAKGQGQVWFALTDIQGKQVHFKMNTYYQSSYYGPSILVLTNMLTTKDRLLQAGMFVQAHESRDTLAVTFSCSTIIFNRDSNNLPYWQSVVR